MLTCSELLLESQAVARFGSSRGVQPCGGAVFTKERMIAVLREPDGGVKTAELYREHGRSDAAFYNCKAEFRITTIFEAMRLQFVENPFVQDVQCRDRILPR